MSKFYIENSFLRVKNLLKWQHYKKRSPPWIKLHRDILSDYKISRLQDDSKLHLILIWLLASQMENKIPADGEWIKKRIDAKNDIDFELFIKMGFIDVIK